MIIQIAKQEIDVGEIGNANTGDILFDGGEKINSNFDGVYNSFGDQRYTNTNTQVGNQTIHATGYFQKVNTNDFRTPLAMGTQWDIDTTVGAATPILGAGKPGECISFINSNGSCSVTRPIVIQPQGGSFVNISTALTVTQPYSRIDCWCISNENNVPIWNYAISSMFGSRETPIEISRAVPVGGDLRVPITHMSEYNTIKLLVTATSVDGQLARQSEINILVDSRKRDVHATEFAVLRIGNANEEDEILDIKYAIGSTDMVELLLSTKHPGIRAAIKSIAVQRVGSA